MGQQQLILLVLATIIVGLAIVVGIRAFNENNIKSNSDAMMQDAVRIANDAQAWKQKPAPFGGQASVDATAAATANDFTGATLPLLGYTDPYVNLNGSFTVAVATGTVTITGQNTKLGNEVQVTVDGLSDIDVDGVVTCLGFVDPSDGSACMGTTS